MPHLAVHAELAQPVEHAVAPREVVRFGEVEEAEVGGQLLLVPLCDDFGEHENVVHGAAAGSEAGLLLRDAAALLHVLHQPVVQHRLVHLRHHTHERDWPVIGEVAARAGALVHGDDEGEQPGVGHGALLPDDLQQCVQSSEGGVAALGEQLVDDAVGARRAPARYLLQHLLHLLHRDRTTQLARVLHHCCRTVHVSTCHALVHRAGGRRGGHALEVVGPCGACVVVGGGGGAVGRGHAFGQRAGFAVAAQLLERVEEFAGVRPLYRLE